MKAELYDLIVYWEQEDKEQEMLDAGYNPESGKYLPKRTSVHD